VSKESLDIKEKETIMSKDMSPLEKYILFFID
jgi:hypothetical protein